MKKALAILSLSCTAAAQVITTAAGTDWVFPASTLPALNAPLGKLRGAAVDGKGNLYVADTGNNMVFEISSSGVLTVLAGNGLADFSGDGGAATGASLAAPSAVALDAAGNLYIADTGNHRVRRVAAGIISTAAGNGTDGFGGDGGLAQNAALNSPGGLAIDSAGNLYIADTANQRIRKLSGGMITTVAGNGNDGFSGDGGPATAAALSYPIGLAADSAGNLFIADSGNSRVRKLSGGTIVTVAGNGIGGFAGDGAAATSASLGGAEGVALDAAGNLYIADTQDHRIRKVSGGIITTLAGNGQPGFSGDGGSAVSASLNLPNAVAVDATGNVYLTDDNERLRRIAPGGTIGTFAGNGLFRYSGDGGPPASASLNRPGGIAVDASGNLYIADTSNNRVRKVSGGVISTIAGNGIAVFAGDSGPAVSASLASPYGVALDGAGNLYIADTGNGRVRKVAPNGTITTVAGTGESGFSGDGGPATSATFYNPYGVAVDAAGNLYVADRDNDRVRKISGGTITTVAGSSKEGFSGDGSPATGAALNFPVGVALDAGGNLYISDSGNHRVRKVSAGLISTVAGNGNQAYSGDTGPALNASLDFPGGISVDSAGTLYIADSQNYVIRKVSGGIITTVAGNGVQGLSGDGGPAIAASLNQPGGVAVDAAGDVFIADTGNNRIRETLKAQVTFQAAPASLSFSGTAGGVAPATQSVNLSATVAGLAYTVSASASWLHADPAAGAIPASLQVTADPSQLAAGTYSGTLTVVAANAAPSMQIVNVSFSVAPASPPQLGVSAQSLAYSVTQGTASASSQLSVLNLGGGSLSFTVSASTSSGGSWLQVAPSGGTATPSNPVSLTVTALAGNLGAGTYSGSIALNPAVGAGINVPVTLSVSAAPQKILLSQTGLSFTAVAQGGTPLPQSFGILNTGQGSMSWTASASTLSGGSNWLSIDQRSGSVATPFLDVSFVTVKIDPSGLAAGAYYGQVQVNAAGAANSPQSVSVVLNLLPAGSNPGPEVHPSALIFTGPAGATPGSEDVLIGNPKAQADSFVSGVIGSGFSFRPASAVVDPKQPATVRVYPDFSRLPAGSIARGTITLQFADGTPRTISILEVVGPSGGASISQGPESARAAAGCSTLLVQPTALTDPSSSVTPGLPATLEARVVDNCGNPVTSGAVTATFSNGDPAVNLAGIGKGKWTATWTPRNASSPRVTIQFTALQGQGTQLASGSATTQVAVQSSGTSPLTVGAANAASYAGTFISPGGLVTIFGALLADQPTEPSSVPFPTQLNGTQVLIGGVPLPLRFVGPGQANAQVPFELAVNTEQQLVVQRGTALSVPQEVVVAAAQPAVYTQDQSGTGPGIIVNSAGLVTAANPAAPGDVVVIYCNGLGAVNPPVPSGTPAPPAGPLSQTVNPLTVTIGGLPAQVNFAGLAPGYPDLYQVNAVVPAGLTSGNSVPVVLSIAGQTSPAVTMAVR